MKTTKRIISVLIIALLALNVFIPAYAAETAGLDVLQQKDPRWSEYPYGSSTLGRSACGTFSTLNAVSYLTKHQFSIDEIHKWGDYAGRNFYIAGQGSMHSVAKGLADRFGPEYNFRCTEKYEFSSYVPLNGTYPKTQAAMDIIWNKLISELQQGRVCVGMVHGHFIALVDYNPQNGKVLTLDSAADMEKRGTTALGDWMTENELYYGSSEGKQYFKLRCCFTFLESTKKATINDMGTAVDTNDFFINAHITNNVNGTISEYGFEIGQVLSNTTTVSIKADDRSPELDVFMSVYNLYRPLAPGTKYYYRVYAVINGETYKSDYTSFVTAGTSLCNLEDITVTEISQTGGKISFWCHNNSEENVSGYGCYIGTEPGNMQRYNIDTDIQDTNSNIILDLAAICGNLKSNTEYYYQAYVVLDGGMYLSNTYKFSTLNVGEQKFIIFYLGNGGINAPQYQTKSYDHDINLSSEEPIRKGYKFIGWATADNATEAEYLPGDIYSGNRDITLYAVWQKDNIESEIDIEKVDLDDEYLLGDANGDSFVNMEDVTTSQKIIAKLIQPEKVYEFCSKSADVTKDGKITMEDVVEIQRYVAKLITEF
ncbi:MAG: InlB B-repeat-containing protein [Clostridiales bacterium]|nr:InlB B-repeat-containing protein [Clostridiales bacterium]